MRWSIRRTCGGGLRRSSVVDADDLAGTNPGCAEEKGDGSGDVDRLSVAL